MTRQVYADVEDFSPRVARQASIAAEGLSVWVGAMKSYHSASKLVKPKLERLVLAEARLQEARRALAEAEERLKASHEHMAELRRAFDDQMAKKQLTADNAAALQVRLSRRRIGRVGLGLVHCRLCLVSCARSTN